MTNTAGARTPWGIAQRCEEMAHGILRYETDSHGGYWLSRDRRDVVLASLGFEKEWWEQADEARLVDFVFAEELGILNPHEPLKTLGELVNALRAEYEAQKEAGR